MTLLLVSAALAAAGLHRLRGVVVARRAESVRRRDAVVLRRAMERVSEISQRRIVGA